jgi:hypothetical protein
MAASNVLATVEKCMYCMRTQEPLKREHVVPLGLNGEWLLRRASCADCERITARLELAVIRDAFRDWRPALRIGGKRRKNILRALPLVLVKDGHERVVNRHTNLLPMVALPVFLPPGKGQPIGISIPGVEMHILNNDPRSLDEIFRQIVADERVDEAFVRLSYEPVQFARFIAKIGYAAAVGGYGLDVIEEVFVLPAIKGEADNVGRWVGMPEKRRLGGQTDQLHRLGVGVDDDGTIQAHVRLFAKFGLPEYMVKVGRTVGGRTDVLRRTTAPFDGIYT